MRVGWQASASSDILRHMRSDPLSDGGCPATAERPPRRLGRDGPASLDDVRGMSTACLTMADVARLLEIDVRTVSRACADGQLPSLRVGRRTLVPREPLIALLEGAL